LSSTPAESAVGFGPRSPAARGRLHPEARDERVLTDPQRFDVTRPITPTQVGFGAGGPHFCLGANLARREIAVMFDELRRRLPDLRTTGEPAYLESSFINGIKRLPCAWG